MQAAALPRSPPTRTLDDTDAALVAQQADPKVTVTQLGPGNAVPQQRLPLGVRQLVIESLIESHGSRRTAAVRQSSTTRRGSATTPVLSEVASTVRVVTTLTDRQQRMLAFERQWWRRDDARIAELFGCAMAQYRWELADLVTLPAALAYDPLLVRRLRRELVAGAKPGRRRHG
jgi:hypothetical protein